MICPGCNRVLAENARFCTFCGANLQQTAKGNKAGPFVVDASDGGRVNINVGGENGGGGQGQYCPICGKFNLPENTFRCKNCGRSFICNAHQDAKTFLCVECNQQTGNGYEQKLFSLNYQFVHPYLAIDEAGLAQVVLNFTSRSDTGLPKTPDIITHLCLVLDVSGSMNTPEKYPLLRQAIPRLIESLADDDYLTIVLFSQGCDVVLSDRIDRCRPRVNHILEQIDHSGITFGRMTLLEQGLRAAINEIKHFREGMPLSMNRLYILTDGEIHDGDACYALNSKLRNLEVELHSYGFGREFSFDTMKKIMEGVPGGTVKPIFNTKDVERVFGHIGDIAQRVVAQEAEFSFRFAGDVIAGDAFRYQPGTHYYGTVDRKKKVFKADLANLERDRLYTFYLEGQARPSGGQSQEIGRASLRYRVGNTWETVETPVIIKRSEDEWRCRMRDDSALEIYEILDALRSDDTSSRLRSLHARRSRYEREGSADPELISLLEKGIDKLESGQFLTWEEEIGLEADDSTQEGPPR